MFSRRRPQLTYANVMSSIAVFLALGGVAYGAAKFTGNDIVDDSLTGADIRESALGQVPDADTLDGQDSATFVRGGGFTRGSSGTVPTNTETAALDLGFVFASIHCGPSPGTDRLLLSGLAAQQIFSVPGPGVQFYAGGSAHTFPAGPSSVRVQAGKRDDPSKVATIWATVTHGDGECRFMLQGLSSG